MRQTYRMGEWRRYWSQPGFWRWWWQQRVSGQAKGATAVIVAALCALGGLLAAQHLAAEPEAVRIVTTRRVVTIADKNRPDAPPRVVTLSETVTRAGEPEVMTVRRNGRTVIVTAPGETVTARRDPERSTDTVVRTQTSERVSTVTAPGTTQTETTQVDGPVRTTTETDTVTDRDEITVTDEVTVTEQLTVTDEVTVTEEVTVTVTERGRP